jgi:hypothetical protein
MNALSDELTRARGGRGPALYYGYCTRSGRYRMMDLPDYLSSVQQGMTRLLSDAQSLYQDVARSTYAPGTGRTGPHHGCDCPDCSRHDCHCDCCITDAEVVVYARCGEVRRIPITLVNDSRREQPVKLDLAPFVTAGGRNLKWAAELPEKEFTLRPCDERTVSVSVAVRCDPPEGASQTAAARREAATRTGSVDRCEVGYATLRAEGCLVRPVVIAVAVLPDHCDAYRRPCGGCCH